MFLIIQYKNVGTYSGYVIVDVLVGASIVLHLMNISVVWPYYPETDLSGIVMVVFLLIKHHILHQRYTSSLSMRQRYCLCYDCVLLRSNTVCIQVEIRFCKMSLDVQSTKQP